jgi:hypothetical protein
MTAMSKQPLISESVAVIRIDVHPIGEEPHNMSYARPLGSHVRQPSAKTLLGQNRAPDPGMKSCFLAIIWPGRHPGLAHSPSIKPPSGREVQFDKVVTKLLRLLGSIKPDMRSVQF